MKAFFDKYKYILGLGLALVVVVIIAVVSAAMGKDAAENSGISYATPEASSFTTVESFVTTTAFQTDGNSQTTPATTVTDTSSQTLPESEKPETTAITSVASTSSTADISKPTEKPVFTSAPTSSASPASSKVTTTSNTSSVISTTPKPDKPIKKYDNTCTFVIECKTILDNKDKLKKGLEKYIPDDAVIFSKTVGFDSGESVYDILRRICDENSIQMEASYTTGFSSYYVEGINNLYEFDCGKRSGWMYSVNGVFPNYGCSSYKPVNNDKIAFRYTCELGYDLQN